MRGRFVAVVGPSGAGKDSLIRFAQTHLEGCDDVAFVRRVVTRPADSASEDHDSMDLAGFAAAEAAGAFVLSWNAHGLRYGLPIALEDDLAEGRLVVANLSRDAISELVARYPDALTVAVTAAPEVIARRLAARGRESAESIQNRLARSGGERLPANAVRIDNSGALEIAGQQFLRLLRDVAGMRV